MSRFLWANDHQIVDVEKISVVSVNQDGKTGTAFVLGHQEPIALNGTPAQDFLVSFSANRPRKPDGSTPPRVTKYGTGADKKR
jgi:hypothetical protein